LNLEPPDILAEIKGVVGIGIIVEQMRMEVNGPDWGLFKIRNTIF
jgi:hypothetical protein